MTLRKCPGCKNMVAVDSTECPICGCEPHKHRVRQIFIWALLAACVLWIGSRVITKKLHARFKPASHVAWRFDGEWPNLEHEDRALPSHDEAILNLQ